MGFVLPNNKLFGLGTRHAEFGLKNGAYTMWARGRTNGSMTDTGLGGQ
jgi:hypothetical protein